jgi:hypothetical protein
MCAASRAAGSTSSFEGLGQRVARSEVSRICAELDEQVLAFLERRLEGDYVSVPLDFKIEELLQAQASATIGSRSKSSARRRRSRSLRRSLALRRRWRAR